MCFYNLFHLIVITETKLDSLDDITVPGFRLYTKKQTFKKKIIRWCRCINKWYNWYIRRRIRYQSTRHWLKIKNHIKNKDLIWCLAYVPPEKSVYSNISIFTEIEDQLNSLRADNCNLEFCLLVTWTPEQAFLVIL